MNLAVPCTCHVIHTEHTVQRHRQIKGLNEARAHTRGQVTTRLNGLYLVDTPKQLRGMHNPMHFWRSRILGTTY